MNKYSANRREFSGTMRILSMTVLYSFLTVQLSGCKNLGDQRGNNNGRDAGRGGNANGGANNPPPRQNNNGLAADASLLGGGTDLNEVLQPTVQNPPFDGGGIDAAGNSSDLPTGGPAEHVPAPAEQSTPPRETEPGVASPSQFISADLGQDDFNEKGRNYVWGSDNRGNRADEKCSGINRTEIIAAITAKAARLVKSPINNIIIKLGTEGCDPCQNFVTGVKALTEFPAGTAVVSFNMSEEVRYGISQCVYSGNQTNESGWPFFIVAKMESNGTLISNVAPVKNIHSKTGSTSETLNQFGISTLVTALAGKATALKGTDNSAHFLVPID